MKNKKVSDEFKVGKNKIGFVSSSFLTEFRKDEIKKGSALTFQKLPRNMTDAEILSELKVQECTFGDILETLKSAPEQAKDGWANLFYVRGHPSHVVFVFLDGSDWRVFAWFRTAGPWGSDLRVFSPATSGAQALSSSSESPLTLPNFIKDLKELIKKYE